MKLDYCQKHRGAPVEDAALPCLAIRHDDGRRVTQRELWAEIERLRAENAALKRDLEYARDGLTRGRTRMREDNERLAREAHTWSKAAETYATQLEHHKPLVRAVRNVLEDGQVYAEDLALLRQALEQVERALGPNVGVQPLP